MLATMLVAAACGGARPDSPLGEGSQREVAPEQGVRDGALFTRRLHSLRGIGANVEMLGFDPSTHTAILWSDFWNDPIGAAPRTMRVHVIDYQRGVEVEHWDGLVAGTDAESPRRCDHAADRYGPEGLMGGGVLPFGCFGQRFEDDVVRFGRLARDVGDLPAGQWRRTLTGLYVAPQGRIALMPREQSLLRIDLEGGAVERLDYPLEAAPDARAPAERILPLGRVDFSPDSARASMITSAGLYVIDAAPDVPNGEIVDLVSLLDLPAPPELESAIWAERDTMYVAFRTSPNFGRSPVQCCLARVVLGPSAAGRVVTCAAPGRADLIAVPGGLGVLALTRQSADAAGQPSGYLTFELDDGEVRAWTPREVSLGIVLAGPLLLATGGSEIVVQDLINGRTVRVDALGGSWVSLRARLAHGREMVLALRAVSDEVELVEIDLDRVRLALREPAHGGPPS